MRTFSLAAVVAAAVTPAFAQSIADQVISQLSDQGYTRIEVKNGPSQIKVEAVRGNRELEIIYDRRTGAILKQEVNAVRAGDDTRPGIQVRNEDRDFLRDRDRHDDDDGDDRRGQKDDDDRDNRRGHGDDDDDDDDDRRGDRGGDDDRDDRRGDRDDDNDDDDDDERDD